MWWQATSGAGIKAGVRLRLAFWLSEKLTNAQLRTWVKTWKMPVDGSLFTPSQPHFVAAPILDGVPDPLMGGKRSDTVEGADVQVPEMLGDVHKVHTATEELAKAARKIARTEHGERRNTLNRLAYILAERYAEDELPSATIREALEKGAQAGGYLDPKAVVTIDEAVTQGRAKNTAKREGWRGLLAQDKEGNFRSTQANVTVFLENHEAFRGHAAWDERAQSPVWLEAPPWGGETPRTIKEVDITKAIEWFQAQAHMDAKPAWVHAGFSKLAQARSFDPVQDYLKGLPSWDDSQRVDSFFIRHLGVPDTQLVRAQTRAWFVQAYKRAFASLSEPVQADYVIVLSGAQGIRKSSTIRALCPSPRFFVDHLPDLTDKDARLLVTGAWLIELAELTQRKADRDVVKAFLSALVDSFRPPYGRDTLIVPRRCVFLATTNENEYLQDPTGNRRFWPFPCLRKADVDEIVAERDQVWAEAKHLSLTGSVGYLSDKHECEAKVAQDSARVEDPIEERLGSALQQKAPPAIMSGVVWSSGQLNMAGYIVEIGTAQACELLGLNAYLHQNTTRVKEALTHLGWVFRKKAAHRVWVPSPNWVYLGAEERLERN
jgi:predicted P-loop ATPase